MSNTDTLSEWEWNAPRVVVWADKIVQCVELEGEERVHPDAVGIWHLEHGKRIVVTKKHHEHGKPDLFNGAYYVQYDKDGTQSTWESAAVFEKKYRPAK